MKHPVFRPLYLKNLKNVSENPYLAKNIFKIRGWTPQKFPELLKKLFKIFLQCEEKKATRCN